MIFVYLTTLFIAPQLWVEPFVGVRADLYVYPLWVAVLAQQGRLSDLFRFRTADWLIVLMIVWMTLSALINSANERSLQITGDYLKFFLLYRLFVASLPSLQSVRNTLWLILAFVMVLVVEGIQHKLDPAGLGWAGQPLGWVDNSVLEAGGTGRTQWINIFDGPGVFCVVYTMGLPIAMILIGRPFGKAIRLLGFIMSCLILLAIYYTGSRGGFLAALGVVGLYLMIRLQVSTTNIAMAVALAVAAYALAPDHLTSVRDEKKSAQHRVQMWVEGVEMTQQNPVFGIGKGNFKRYSGRLIAHNSAIEIMGETGLPGLLLWVSMVYLALKGLLRLRAGPYDPLDKACATALLLIMAGYLISAMFVTLEYETFYMLLAICAAVANAQKDPVKFERRDAIIAGSITLSFFLAIKLFVMAYF